LTYRNPHAVVLPAGKARTSPLADVSIGMNCLASGSVKKLHDHCHALTHGTYRRTHMPTTVVRTYDDIVNAESARNDLLVSGFPSSNVHLSSLIDEAGPVQGNFVLDDKDTGSGPGSSALTPKEHTDAYNNDRPHWGGAYVLAVDAEDEDQGTLASDIMDRYHVIVADRHSNRLH
jgi:hypothetical protein